MPSDFKAPAGATLTLSRSAPKEGRAVQRPEVRVYGGNDEMELRAGIEPLAQLLDERAHLVEQVADLRAKYGSFGTWDHLRKIELSRLKALVRLEAQVSKAKMTNDMVDEEAHSRHEYVEFVNLASQERARWFKLEAKLEAIDYKINRGQGLLRFAASEPRT